MTISQLAKQDEDVLDPIYDIGTKEAIGKTSYRRLIPNISNLCKTKAYTSEYIQSSRNEAVSRNAYLAINRQLYQNCKEARFMNKSNLTFRSINQIVDL